MHGFSQTAVKAHSKKTPTKIVNVPVQINRSLPRVQNYIWTSSSKITCFNLNAVKLRVWIKCIDKGYAVIVYIRHDCKISTASIRTRGLLSVRTRPSPFVRTRSYATRSYAKRDLLKSNAFLCQTRPSQIERVLTPNATFSNRTRSYATRGVLKSNMFLCQTWSNVAYSVRAWPSQFECRDTSLRSLL